MGCRATGRIVPVALFDLGTNETEPGTESRTEACPEKGVAAARGTLWPGLRCLCQEPAVRRWSRYDEQSGKGCCPSTHRNLEK